ncbi:Zn-dependent alcohol dehydrogenase [Oxalobacteraceae bacterium GrIS 1.11]
MNQPPDFCSVGNYLVPTDALIVQGCLVAAGVPAVLADANLVQTYSLLTSALGGVRILVPSSHLAQARAIIAAFERGDYQLEDDVDVGEAQ